MKKTITAALLATTGAFSLSAQDYSVTADFTFESEYVFRGVFLAQNTFMPSLEVAAGDFYAGIWTAQPVDGKENGVAFDNEIDLYAGYGFAAGDVTTIDVGATLYWYPENGGAYDDTTFEPFIGAAFDVATSPALYLYYDTELETMTLEGSLGYSFELSEAASLDLGAFLGFVDPDGGDEYTYYGATADLVYSLNETSSISAGIRLSDVDEDAVGKGRFWWGASFTTGF